MQKDTEKFMKERNEIKVNMRQSTIKHNALWEEFWAFMNIMMKDMGIKVYSNDDELARSENIASKSIVLLPTSKNFFHSQQNIKGETEEYDHECILKSKKQLILILG